MPTDATVILLPEHQDFLLSITSARLRKALARRLIALQTFPQQGAIDNLMPHDSPHLEHRVTYVSPYAIRYTYDQIRNEARVDSITDERTGSLARFL